MNINEIWLNGYLYRYAYYQCAHEGAPLGVFLIGNLQEIESVNFFSEYFSGYLNLYVVEVPGTGLTDPLLAVDSIQDQSSLLLDFLECVNISNAHILAFSYATPVALELCVKWSGAITLSMCGGMVGIPKASRLTTMAILGDAIRDRKRFAEEFIKGLTVSDKSIPRGKVIARSARQKVFQYTEKQVRCFCENTVRILAYKPSDFSTLVIPCFLFIGKKDPYVTIENALNLVGLLPNCGFDVVENADHLVHLECPDVTAELMVRLAKETMSYKPLNRHTQSKSVA